MNSVTICFKKSESICLNINETQICLKKLVDNKVYRLSNLVNKNQILQKQDTSSSTKTRSTGAGRNYFVETVIF